MTVHNIVVGLSGKKRAGKDEAASVLVGEYGFTRVAFADPLKEAALALDPLVRIEWDERGPLREAGLSFWRTDSDALHRLSELVATVGWDAAKGVREVRRTLQRLGVEVGREKFGSSFWIDQAMRRIADIDGPVVVTDVRFENELRAIQSLPFGFVYRIERPGLPAEDAHSSETALDDYEPEAFTAVLVNNKSVEHLHALMRTEARYVLGMSTIKGECA